MKLIKDNYPEPGNNSRLNYLKGVGTSGVVAKLKVTEIEPKKSNSLEKGDLFQNVAISTGYVPKENIFKTAKINIGTSLPKKEVEIKNFQIDYQGDTNSCGTTSLTAVLRHHGLPIKDHWEIDKSIRSTRFDFFTAPGDIVDYAKSKGFNAGMKNNGSYEEIAKFIDKGLPVITLIDSGGQNDFYMHWVVVSGYERNEQGMIDNLKVADPGYGSVSSTSVKDFDAVWKNVKVGYENLAVLGSDSYSTGYNRMFIAIAPKNKNITAPDGSTINTKQISIPQNFDTYQGYGAKIVAKTSRVIDRGISLGEEIAKKIGF